MIVTLGTTPALQRTMRFQSLRVDSVNRAIAVHEHTAGKSNNAARVVHTMGKPCIATGFLGGSSGEFCRRELESAGIAQQFVEVQAKTRTCITLIDQTLHTATELVEESPAVTRDDAQNLLNQLDDLLKAAKVLILAGTLAPGCGEDFYARCTSAANTRNVPVILDAKGQALKLALKHNPFIVKPNRSELATTVGGEIESTADLQRAIRQIIDMGATWAVVSNGAAETIVSNGQEFRKIQSPTVNVISPIGSGDALAAGLAMALMDGKAVPEACISGVACGTANAMSEYSGYVNAGDVLRLQLQIKVEPLVY